MEKQNNKHWFIGMYGCHFLRIEDDGDCHHVENPLKRCEYYNCPIKMANLDIPRKDSRGTNLPGESKPAKGDINE